MSNQFPVQPIGRFAGASQPVRRPKVRLFIQLDAMHAHLKPQEIACFSYDDKHGFSLGDSSMKWYYTPQLGADLSKGFDTFQKLDDSKDEHLDSLLTTIMSHEKEAGKKIDANFVTWRGMMTKVRCASFI